MNFIEHEVSIPMFNLLTIQARLKSAISQGKRIDPSLLIHEVQEAIVYLDDMEKAHASAE